MADEQVPSHLEPHSGGVTPELPAHTRGPASRASAAITDKPRLETGRGQVSAEEEGERERSGLSLLLGWYAGALLVFFSGWGLFGLVLYFTRDTEHALIPSLAGAALLSLGLFWLLEHKLWLSRFMGLNIPPRFAGWYSVLLLWLFGIVTLMFRSTAPRTAHGKELVPQGYRASESSGREVVETVVFVVVLVLLLKSFAAEAFVIPTGSMAETLLGYQKMVKCPSCGHVFPVNCSSEVDPQDNGPRVPINFCTCPNCRQLIRLVDPKRDGGTPRSGVQRDTDSSGRVLEYREIPDPGASNGDRVLVGKFFDLAPSLMPKRLSVVVFKYPEGPQKGQVAINYIKRLIGLPGETIAICGGNLYRLRPEQSPKYDDSKVPPKERWRKDSMHAQDERAVELFKADQFEIIHKPPAVLLAMMRLVYDNDHQATDLEGKEWQRWLPETEGWETLDGAKAFRSGARAESSGAVDWLHYRHLLRQNAGRRSLITDFMGYNSGASWSWDSTQNQWRVDKAADRNGVNWVGDLILECEVKVEKAEGELVLQLVRGRDTFQATWDLSAKDGRCTLTRTTIRDGKKETKTLRSEPTKLRKRTYRLRFANVDNRLTVWVDGELPFGEGESYVVTRATKDTPTAADLTPASIGVKGATLSVRKIKLFRDTYHTLKPGEADTYQPLDREKPAVSIDNWLDSLKWDGLGERSFLTLYVQPDHFLCLGDNSLASSDGRSWGLVPRRLLLGKALLVYWPARRAGRIR